MSTGAHSATRAVGTALAIATAILVLAATAFDIAVGASGREAPVAYGWFATIPAVALAASGWVIVRRRPDNPIGVVMLAFAGVTALSGLGSAWVNASVTVWPDLPLVEVALVANQRLYSLLLLGIVAVFVLFPDGRLPSRIVPRTLAIIGSSLGGFAVIATLLMPWDAMARRSGPPDPSVAGYYVHDWGLELTAAAWDTIALVVLVGQNVAIGAAFASILARTAGADLELRRQARWVGWAAALLVLSLVLWPLVPYGFGLAGMLATFVVLCVAIAIAITRHRLASIDRVIGWTLVYALLVIAVVVLDVVLLALVGELLGERTAAIVSAVIVLVVFAPLREPLLAGVQRIVYGRRGDPYGVVAGLADELERADAADDQLAHIVRTVASAFAADYVRIRVDQPDGSHASAAHGASSQRTTTIPLTYRGETIGELELSQPRRVRLSRRDEQLLADVVRQAAAAVRATLHGIELQRARAELVIAREAERRRLRRDIHDGLGPSLAAVKLRIDAARNVAATDPDASGRMLDGASALVTETVADIRRIVHDLRPPALDDLGLRGAIERVCDAAGPGDVSVELHFDVPQPLPAAVEVAALRIVSETLTNTRRHAHAENATVTVSLAGDALRIEVADDGRGLSATDPAGVGLRSMRERAAELDGTLTTTNRPTGGTLVVATLPLLGPVAPGGQHG